MSKQEVESIECLSCYEDITALARYTLHPCGCTICPCCFGEMHARRNLALPICLGCTHSVERHTCLSYRRKLRCDRMHQTNRKSTRYLAIGDGLDSLESYLDQSPANQMEDVVIAIFARRDNKKES
jgi:hypothetical protein